MNTPLVIHLRELLHAQPFQAFSFKLVDGTSFTVPHEDFLSVTKSGNVIFDDGEKTYKTINVNLITVIDEKVTV